MSAIKDFVYRTFKKHFPSNPILIKSPGRVNLIGEHTDYNDGFVLPAAIDKAIYLAISKNRLNTIRAIALDLKESVEIDLNQLQSPEKQWANFIKGVIVELKAIGKLVSGFDVVFAGDIPIGAGLSSSAALEGGLLTGLNELFSLELTKTEMARLGQLTEHNHIGVHCGIMDQFINLHGEKGKALKLDCRTLKYELYPIDTSDLNIVLCNSKVSHNLASSEYNVRREQCEEGVQTLKKYDNQIKNLRDVPLELLEKSKNELSTLVYQRCKFVLEENERVHNACNHLQEDDLIAFGKRMFESHHGLSKEYEVSCEELDILVELAKTQEGVLGSRMMGGGFGGCTINLVRKNHVQEFEQFIKDEYKKLTDIQAEVYVTTIGDGTSIVEN